MLDLKTLSDIEMNPHPIGRTVPLRRCIHVTVHAYNDLDNIAWFQTTIFYDNHTMIGTPIPQRHYEDWAINTNLDTTRGYNLYLGDYNFNSTGDSYTFQVDDLTVFQGGTIQTHGNGSKIEILQ
jgi:hypothetical protein